MTSGTKHPPARGHRVGDDGGIVSVIPYLVVVAGLGVGLSIAWSQGTTGGGRGTVVGGIALLAGALLRLVLPAPLVGLLGARKRVIDVLTLTVFGVGLIAAGLVLPR